VTCKMWGYFLGSGCVFKPSMVALAAGPLFKEEAIESIGAGGVDRGPLQLGPEVVEEPFGRAVQSVRVRVPPGSGHSKSEDSAHVGAICLALEPLIDPVQVTTASQTASCTVSSLAWPGSNARQQGAATRPEDAHTRARLKAQQGTERRSTLGTDGVLSGAGRCCQCGAGCSQGGRGNPRWGSGNATGVPRS